MISTVNTEAKKKKKIIHQYAITWTTEGEVNFISDNLDKKSKIVFP